MSKLCHFLSLQVAYLLANNLQSAGPLENKVFYLEEGKVGPQYLYRVMSTESSLSLEQIWKMTEGVWRGNKSCCPFKTEWGEQKEKKKRGGNLIYIRKNGILSFFFFFIPVYISTPYLQCEADRWNRLPHRGHTKRWSPDCQGASRLGI